MSNEEGKALRYSIYFSTILIIVTALTLQLIRIQILNSGKFKIKANENSVKAIPVAAPRGVIFDRNFNLLVGNKPSYNLVVIPAYFDTSSFTRFGKLLGFSKETKLEIIRAKRKYSKFKPIVVRRDIPFDVVSGVNEYGDELTGVKVEFVPKRDYAYGVNGAHIFGYLQEITADELKNSMGEYVGGDEIGASGIEKYYEKYLRGKKGKKLVVVNSRQQYIRDFRNGAMDLPPAKGDDIVLSIDKKTQIAAENALKGKKGAIVAIVPKTGEIIAMASAPTFSLSELSVASPSEWRAIVFNKDKPLFNRATMSAYPPGSTIKPLEALAGLASGSVTPRTTIICKGGLQYGDRFFGCDHIHGKVNMVKSIEESCNTYYYLLFLKMGFAPWLDFTRRFGFGRKTHIDIYEEKKGLLPDSAYYNKRFGRHRWNKGLLLSLSIGQGEVSVTPLQLAKYTALIAGGGKTVVPHLAKGFIDNKTNAFHPFSFDSVKINLNKNDLAVVKKGMFEVVNGEGTATNIKDAYIPIAGKTGTAQNPHGENHAIFIAYAPADNPKIAVAVVIENAGYGSTHAAPVAHKIIRTYLRNLIHNKMRKLK